MIRLNIVVEGQTEETFVRDTLAPHLGTENVFAVARRVETGRKRRLIGGRDERRTFRGGLPPGSYERAKADICRWMAQDGGPAARFTTMFDLYRLPENFPGWEESKRVPDPYEKVAVLEEALARDIGDRRFVPYVQLHEFEALLFADISKLRRWFVEPDYDPAIERLVALARSFDGPEWIDDGVETAPSRRIGHEIPQYLSVKSTAGPQVAAEIGLEQIERRCRHFAEWLGRLRVLGAESPSP